MSQLISKLPIKASSHFINKKYDDLKKKFTVQCKHCLKVVNDNKNILAKVYHLQSAHPKINSINKKNGKSICSNFGFDVEINNSKNPDSIDKPITAIIAEIPIKTLLTAKIHTMRTPPRKENLLKA